MTFHLVGSSRGIIKEKRNGVWLVVSERTETKGGKKYHGTVLAITIYDDILGQVGWQRGMDIMIEVGADIDAGLIRLRPAGPGESGLRLRKRGGYAVDLERHMGGFPLPEIAARPSVAAKKIAIDNGAIMLVLPGEWTRDLRAAQEAALKAMKGVEHAEG